MNLPLSPIFFICALYFLLNNSSYLEAQVTQTFNNGGQNTSNSNNIVSSNFGEVFVKTYQVSGLHLYEGILTSNLLVLSVQEDETTPFVKVYPNPLNDELTIQTSYPGSKFMIFTMSGLLVRQGNLNELKTIIRFVEAPDQWYFLKIEDKKNGKISTFKIRREK